jgi:GT2 family glycosyltransferase
MLSVVIPHWSKSSELDYYLERCVKSLKGHNEVIVYANEGIGFAKALNGGLRLAHGDYILALNNDVFLDYGDLKDLCIPNVVTSPTLNSKAQNFWGSAFCLPRTIYKKVGPYSEEYGMGYFEDDDYIERLKQAGVEMRCIESVNFLHPKGGSTMETLYDRDKIFKDNRNKFLEKWGRLP